MNDYEGVFILEPNLSEEDGEKLISTIEEVISKNKGTVEKKEKWGKRSLAYEIKEKQEGLYFSMNFKIEPKAISELKRVYGLNGSILRYLIFRK